MSKTMLIPRGTPGLASISLEMESIYLGERRLAEVAAANPMSAAELMGYFNEVCNLTTKYLAWVEYEILTAQKFLGLAKATVMLEKAHVELMKYDKASGMKNNEDFREALIAKDPECQRSLDALNMLLSVRALLDNKARTFVRAYNACKVILERKSSMAASPNLNGTIGSSHGNVMGAPDEDYGMKP